MTCLGRLLRTFKNEVCSTYETRELPSEEAARDRQNAALVAKKKLSQTSKKKTKQTQEPRRRKLFNLNTYKVHALGAYPRAIRLYGTSDNYNSQTVRLF